MTIHRGPDGRHDIGMAIAIVGERMDLVGIQIGRQRFAFDLDDAKTVRSAFDRAIELIESGVSRTLPTTSGDLAADELDAFIRRQRQ